MQKNRLYRKKFKIVSPMVLSMALLVSFVGYWLHSQYYNEKENLQTDLSRLYHQSSFDVEFIIYYNKVIKPALSFKDSTNYKNLKIGTENTTAVKKQEFIQELKTFIDSNQNYKEVFQSIEENQLIPDSIRDNRQFDILDIGYKYQIYNGRYLAFTDTIIKDTIQNFYRKLFLRNLDSKFPGIKIKNEESIDRRSVETLERTQEQTLARGRLGIFAYQGWENQTMVLLFDKYFFYLITVILPQIIFGFVLIGLSVFALVFAYRSYLTQAKLNMLRTDFVSNITHELKIPVATAKAAMEALLQYGITDDKEKTISYLKMVSMEMNRLDSLTTRVLEHSRLENHHHPLHKEETNMNNFVGRIAHSVKLFYPNSINIRYQIPSENISIPIDQVYIEGVIRNLIENSKKYGGHDVSISVNLWKENGHVYISVIDNGPGIPKEYLSKVFDRFFRVPTGDKHNVKGFGLGLSFASLVMKQHNGTIKANNLSDKGCEIVLEFPA